MQRKHVFQMNVAANCARGGAEAGESRLKMLCIRFRSITPVRPGPR
jgi:hypothetical protein